MSQPIQPIFIMPEGSSSQSGKTAQRTNIAAAKAVADTIRSTLGPKGMDKMLVDAAGEVTVTNDGVTILRELDVQHPAAKMIVEVAKNQEHAVGDGTTTSVILAGELLKQAESLLDLEIHPTILAKGYHLAGKKAQEILKSLAKPITSQETQLLHKVASTAMTGKGAELHKEQLSQLMVEAILNVNSNKQANTDSILENIKVEAIRGTSIEQSTLVRGVVLSKERVHPQMPKQVSNAKIALLNCPLEIRSTEIDAKIQITNPTQLSQFLAQEEEQLKTMIKHIASTGATVVFCQKGIDELAQHYLAKHNILAVRRVRKADMEMLAQASSARISNNFKELTADQLGSAGQVTERKENDEEYIFIEQCPNPQAVTLLIRGGTQHVIDEIKRAVEDALGDLAATIQDGKVLAGAGATEVLLARELERYAQTLSSREQLAVKAFAKALEIIPRTLAENAGIDPIDILAKLHSSQVEWPGINVFSASCIDSWQQGIIEPLRIKTQAIASAAEVAELILRIDDVIIAGAAGQQGPGPMPPPGMMPRM